VLVYCHASGSTLDELSVDFQRHLDLGYLAIRAQAAIPGLEKTYGIAPTDGKIYEPASGNVPQEDIWETSYYLDFAPQMMAYLRSEFGYEVHLLHDVHHRLTPIEAGRLGASLEPYRMFWIEDPTPAEDQSAYRLIRQYTTTPIAVGEVFNSIWDCQQLIIERLIDYIRTSVSHAGGITHLRRIFALADLYGVPLRLPRCRRPVPDLLGRRTARRPEHSQLRHPGVHGTPRPSRRRVRRQLHVPGRLHASRPPTWHRRHV
jgi:mannonate dehydratase